MRVGRTYQWTQPKGQNKSKNTLMATILCACGFVFFLFTAFTRFRTYRDMSASLSRLAVVPGTPMVHPDGNGRVIHLQFAQNELLPQQLVGDNDFLVNAPGAWTMRRDVQVCQWREHVVERKQDTHDGNERVTRTYYYTRGWERHYINSLLFDQPAAHHNPHPPLYPEGTVSTTPVGTTRGYTISAPLSEHVDSPLVTLEYNPQTLQQFLQSGARLQRNFFYTGNGGWFVSKYNPSGYEQMMRSALMYMEGTLFDFQIGDLFSSCTPGDVRVSFSARIPTNGVSVIALQQDATGTLAPFRSLGGREIFLIQEGTHSISSMINTFIGGHRTRVLIHTGLAAGSGILTYFAYRAYRNARKEQRENEEQQQAQQPQYNEGDVKGSKLD